METVYLETSFISYLAALPSANNAIFERQQISRYWWETQREQYDLVISDAVSDELSRGDAMAAQRRLSFVKGIKSLVLTDVVTRLSGILLKECGLPRKADVDATHVAFAVFSKADFMLTWNLARINNPHFKARMRRVCAVRGYSFPEICTPEELLGGYMDGR